MINKLLVIFCSVFLSSILTAQVESILIKDINSSGDGYPYSFIVNGDELYFFADDGIHGVELWKTDGTEGGTVLVKDVNAGSEGQSDVHRGVSFKGKVFLTLSDGVDGNEFWVSDGTEEGTVLVKDLQLAPEEQGSPDQYFIYEDDIVFRGVGTNTKIWLSDGTIEGTTSIDSISDGFYKFIFKNTLYLTGDDGVSGNELWKTNDIRSGFELVKDIDPNGDGHPFDFVHNDEFIYFFANDGIHGREPWKSDGTEEGTMMIKDLNLTESSKDNDGQEIIFNNEWYFQANDGFTGKELWKSDGTEEGTVLVKDININGDSDADGFFIFNEELYFEANDGVNGRELWKTDGSSNGTSLVKDISEGEKDTYVDFVGVFNDQLLFIVYSEGETSLWETDGTLLGTQQLIDINPFGSDELEDVIVFKNSLYVTATDGVSGVELFRIDGLIAGVNKLESSVKIQLFPNPSSTMVHLEIEGDEVLKVNAISSTGITEELKYVDGSIDIESLISGVYLLEIETKSKRAAKARFVKN